MDSPQVVGFVLFAMIIILTTDRFYKLRHIPLSRVDRLRWEKGNLHASGVYPLFR
jgi:hypothetical protein